MVRRLAAGIALAVLVAGCTIPGITPKAAQLTPDQVFARVKPTLVLVQVDYSAKISLPTPDVADAAITTIRNKLQAEFDSGRHPELLNHDAYTAAFDQELYDNPDEYFSPSKDVTSSDGEALEINGSGFVASEDGFIATSAHVVATKDDEIKQKINDFVLQGIKAGFAASVLTDTKRTADQKQKFQIFFEKYAAQYLKIENQKKEIHVALAKGTPGQTLQAKGIPATVAATGEPVPGKDVAILKIDPGSSKLPSLAVGDENSLKSNDELAAIGYPGDSIFKDQSTDPRQVEPTITHGGYQRASEPQTGYNAFATRATIQAGESGGPMVDGQGRVVGVIAFGIADVNGNIQPDLGFAVPASVIKEYLGKAKAGAGQSQTESEYRMALAEFDQKHFKTALPLFRDAKSRWKDNPYVDAYISDSEKGIVDKADKTPPSIGELAAWGGGGVVGLALLVLLTWFVLHRRRAHKRLVAALQAAGARQTDTATAAAPAAGTPTVAAVTASEAPPASDTTVLVARPSRAARAPAKKAATPARKAAAPAKKTPAPTEKTAAPAKKIAAPAKKAAKPATKAAAKPVAPRRTPSRKPRPRV